MECGDRSRRFPGASRSSRSCEQQNDAARAAARARQSGDCGRRTPKGLLRLRVRV